MPHGSRQSLGAARSGEDRPRTSVAAVDRRLQAYRGRRMDLSPGQRLPARAVPRLARGTADHRCDERIHAHPHLGNRGADETSHPAMMDQPMNAELELVSIVTDTYPLDGLLYIPRGRRPRAAAMIFHGNCHNFYTGPSRFLPEALVADDIACLAFNRRGHEMVTSL